MLLVGVSGLVIIGESVMSKGIMKSLDFNFVIFLFLTLNAFCTAPRKSSSMPSGTPRGRLRRSCCNSPSTAAGSWE